MIRCLGTIFHLAETHMDTFCRLTEHLCKELIAHKVRAGTCSQITAILYQLHAAQIDLTVALDGVFHGASGLREGGRIQDHQIVLLALGLQLRKLLDFVKAGGSRITRSYFSPSASSFGSRSNTSAQRNFTLSERPLRAAFFSA